MRSGESVKEGDLCSLQGLFDQKVVVWSKDLDRYCQIELVTDRMVQ